MHTLMLALGEKVQCVGQGVAFRLTGTEPARFYIITHSPLRIERDAFTPSSESIT